MSNKPWRIYSEKHDCDRVVPSDLHAGVDEKETHNQEVFGEYGVRTRELGGWKGLCSRFGCFLFSPRLSAL